MHSVDVVRQFLVFMLRHKILKSKFNRPAKLSMPLGVR